MDELQSQELLKQVRTAHRLVVAYYKRLHIVLKDIGLHSDLGLEFFQWGPTEYLRPCQRRSDVFKSWTWDLAPGISTEYLFQKKQSKDGLIHGDWLLALHVVSDTAVTNENLKGNIDPLKLPDVSDSQSVVRLYLIAPNQNLPNMGFDGLWQKAKKDITMSDEVIGQLLNIDKGIYGAGFEIGLEHLLTDTAVEDVVKRIKEHMGAIIPRMG